MDAASCGHLSILLILLQHSANPDLQEVAGDTALMLAAYNGHEACVKALLRAKANPDLLDKYGHTALMWAAHRGNEACVKALLRAKANTELLDNNGHTALQHAEAKGHTAIAKLIRQHAACSACVACGATAAACCGGAACCRMSFAMAVWPLFSAHCRTVRPLLSSSSVLALARSRACTHASCPLRAASIRAVRP